jgi:hypothetical protein
VLRNEQQFNGGKKCFGSVINICPGHVVQYNLVILKATII